MAGPSSRSWPRVVVPASSTRSCRRSSRTLERVAGLVPTWPRWLNAKDLDPATIEWRPSSGAGRSPWSGTRSIAGSIARARAAGLEVAAWTVRRRDTSTGSARLGVIAVCVEAAALDG